MVSGGKIHTPSETENCLLGITRDSVIELASKELGMEVVSRRMHRS